MTRAGPYRTPAGTRAYMSPERRWFDPIDDTLDAWWAFCALVPDGSTWDSIRAREGFTECFLLYSALGPAQRFVASLLTEPYYGDQCAWLRARLRRWFGSRPISAR